MNRTLTYSPFSHNLKVPHRVHDFVSSCNYIRPNSYLFQCHCQYLLTYLLTLWSRVLTEKLTTLHLVKKFPAFYGNRRFITAVTSARHLSLSWASSIQSIPPHPTSWRPVLMLFSHLRLGLPSGLFPSGFPTKTPYTPLPSPYALHVPPISFFSILSPEQYGVRLSLMFLSHWGLSCQQFPCMSCMLHNPPSRSVWSSEMTLLVLKSKIRGHPAVCHEVTDGRHRHSTSSATVPQYYNTTVFPVLQYYSTSSTTVLPVLPHYSTTELQYFQ